MISQRKAKVYFNPYHTQPGIFGVSKLQDKIHCICLNKCRQFHHRSNTQNLSSGKWQNPQFIFLKAANASLSMWAKKKHLSTKGSITNEKTLKPKIPLWLISIFNTKTIIFIEKLTLLLSSKQLRHLQQLQVWNFILNNRKT